MLTYSQTDFTGGMCEAPATIRNGSAEIFNGRVWPDGSIKSRTGSRRAHASALNGGAAGYGFTTYLTSGGTLQWISFFGSKAYKSTDNGASWTEIASGLQSQFWTFTTFKSAGTNYLVCANGDTTMYSWDGTTWAALTGPTSGMYYVAAFNNRLYCAGNSSTVYGSAINNMTTWTAPDGVVLPFDTGIAENIRGIFALGAYLLVFKPSSTSYMDGFGNSDIIVAAGGRGISSSIGCVGMRTVVAINANTAMWVAYQCIVKYTVGGQIEIISNNLRRTLLPMNWRFMTDTANGLYPCAEYFPFFDEAMFALCDTSTTTGADTVVKVNIHTGAMSIDYYSDGLSTTFQIRALCMVLHRSADRTSLPVNVSGNGYVIRLESGDALDELTSTGTGGTYFFFEWTSRIIDFGNTLGQKQARVLRLSLSGSDADFVTAYVQSDPSYNTFQAFTPGHDFFMPASPAGNAVHQHIARISLRGCTFQVQIAAFSDDGGINLSIYGYELMVNQLKRLTAGIMEPFV